MNHKIHTVEMDNLMKGILNLQSIEECYAFFEDLCTVGELQTYKQRYLVAGLLEKGMTYNEVAAATGASPTTISRVNRCLNHGNNGYKLVLSRD